MKHYLVKRLSQYIVAARLLMEKAIRCFENTFYFIMVLLFASTLCVKLDVTLGKHRDNFKNYFAGVVKYPVEFKF